MKHTTIRASNLISFQQSLRSTGGVLIRAKPFIPLRREVMLLLTMAKEEAMARISGEVFELINKKLDKQIALTNAKDEDGLQLANFILEGFTSSQLEMVKDFIESFS